MDKKEIEKKLYDFFRNENKLDILRNQISILKKQIESINEDLKNCNVSIDVPYYSAGFDEKVQSSRSYTGEAEREVMRETEKMLSRIRNKKFEIENLKELIEVIEIDIMKFNKIFKFLSEDELKLIKLKYKYRKSEEFIATELIISQSQTNRIKNRTLKKIISYYV